MTIFNNRINIKSFNSTTSVKGEVIHLVKIQD